MNDPNQPDANVQVASNTNLGQNLAFKVSGEGVLETRQEGDGSQGSAAPEGGQSQARPGGGLGPPIDAPDPLQKYRWYILGVRRGLNNRRSLRRFPPTIGGSRSGAAEAGLFRRSQSGR